MWLRNHSIAKRLLVFLIPLSASGAAFPRLAEDPNEKKDRLASVPPARAGEGGKHECNDDGGGHRRRGRVH